MAAQITRVTVERLRLGPCISIRCRGEYRRSTVPVPIVAEALGSDVNAENEELATQYCLAELRRKLRIHFSDAEIDEAFSRLVRRDLSTPRRK